MSARVGAPTQGALDEIRQQHVRVSAVRRGATKAAKHDHLARQTRQVGRRQPPASQLLRGQLRRGAGAATPLLPVPSSRIPPLAACRPCRGAPERQAAQQRLRAQHSAGQLRPRHSLLHGREAAQQRELPFRQGLLSGASAAAGRSRAGRQARMFARPASAPAAPASALPRSDCA